MVAFQQLEGQGYWNQWAQTGLICSVMANCWSTGKRFDPSDFMPQQPQEHDQQPQTAEQVFNQFKALKSLSQKQAQGTK